MTALRIEENSFPPLFDLGPVWTTLWQRRLTVLASICAGMLLALVYLAVTKPTYTATASLLIDPRDIRSTRFEDVLPGIGADSAAVASQVFVIESRDLLMAVFESEGIETDPEFAKADLLSLLLASGSSKKDMTFKRFERRISVERAGLTYVIEVGFKSEVPEKAARIANAIVVRYKTALAGERESANTGVNAFLADRVAALQQNVADAERAAGDFKIRHGILDAAAGGTLQSQIDQLTAQLITARAGADQAKGRYEQAVAASSSPAGLARLSEIVSSEAVDSLRTDYHRRAAELASAEAIYQLRHPTIRRLRSELARTRGLLTAEAGRVTRELKAKYDLSVLAAGTIDAKLGVLRLKSQAADRARVELRRLEAKTQAARIVLDDVLKRAEETSQMRGLQLSEAKVIGMAAPPVQPTWPLPMLLLPVSGMLGLVTGCGIAVALGPIGFSTTPGSTTERRRAGRTAAMTSFAMPISLGRCDLPGPAGADIPSRIRAMRRRFLQPGGEAFSQKTLALVRRVIALLTEHPAPYVILISSLRHPAKAKLAGTMIGMGLKKAGQNVLIVELRMESRAGAPDEMRAYGADIMIDGASGLPTMVRTLGSGEAGLPLASEEAVTDSGDFDFILLIGPPLADRLWDSVLLPKLDLMLFALAADEDAAGVADLLPQRFGASRSVPRATLVVTSEEAGGAVTAAQSARARLKGHAL